GLGGRGREQRDDEGGENEWSMRTEPRPGETEVRTDATASSLAYERSHERRHRDEGDQRVEGRHEDGVHDVPAADPASGSFQASRALSSSLTVRTRPTSTTSAANACRRESRRGSGRT